MTFNCNETVIRSIKVNKSELVCVSKNETAIELTSEQNIQFEALIPDQISSSCYHPQSWPYVHVQWRSVASSSAKSMVLRFVCYYHIKNGKTWMCPTLKVCKIQN